MIITCYWTDPPHEHVFPADWKFGGANGLHPGADPRWKPNIYSYYDAEFKLVYVTSEFLCDDEAIYQFTKIRSFGSLYEPRYLTVTRPDGTVEPIPWIYDYKTDTVTHSPPAKGSPSC